MKELSDSEYAAIVRAKAAKSPVLKNCLSAFAVGGAICGLGEILSQIYGMAGADEKQRAMMVSVSLIALSAVLTACHVYDRIARHAGAGTLVPITGFANSIVAPAMEFRPEGWILGVGVKMFSIAGPVLAYGGALSFICGLIRYVWEVIV